MGIAFIVAVVIGAVYVARRSHHPRGIGAFRNRPTGASADPMPFAGDDNSSSADSSDAGGGDGGDGG